MQSIAIPRQMGQVVRMAREQSGLTQEGLAESAGVSRQLIMRLETGSATGVQLDKLMHVLDALDLHLFIASGGESLDGRLPPVQRATCQGDAYRRALGQVREGSAIDMTLFAPRDGGVHV